MANKMGRLVSAETFERVYRRLMTYHNHCERDHDSSQQLVGYGVLFEGVSNRLIVTEETPFERVVLRGEDKKREPGYRKKRNKRQMMTLNDNLYHSFITFSFSCKHSCDSD